MFKWLKGLFSKSSTRSDTPESGYNEVIIHDLREDHRSAGNDISLSATGETTARAVMWTKSVNVGEFILVELEGEEVTFSVMVAEKISNDFYVVELEKVEYFKEEE